MLKKIVLVMFAMLMTSELLAMEHKKPWWQRLPGMKKREAESSFPAETPKLKRRASGDFPENRDIIAAKKKSTAQKNEGARLRS